MFYFSNVTLASIYQIHVSVKCHKIGAQKHCAKYQHFTFCSFTVFNNLKLCISSFKHQHSKSFMPLQPKNIRKKCKWFPRVNLVHIKCSKCPPFARTHAWRRFLHWSIAVSIISCRKSD